jgi:energy-converting hydrogenase Eha subunit F
MFKGSIFIELKTLYLFVYDCSSESFISFGVIIMSFVSVFIFFVANKADPNAIYPRPKDKVVVKAKAIIVAYTPNVN